MSLEDRRLTRHVTAPGGDLNINYLQDEIIHQWSLIFLPQEGQCKFSLYAFSDADLIHALLPWLKRLAIDHNYPETAYFIDTNLNQLFPPSVAAAISRFKRRQQ